MKKRCNGWSVCGIIVGVTIIVFGFIVLDKKVKFGGDFYTEIYRLIRLGFGFLLISLGMTDVFLFGRKLYDYESVSEKVQDVVETEKEKTESDDALPFI